MIKELRTKMKSTQNDFAEYFEIPLKTVQGWEQGRRNPPEYLIKMMYKIWEKDGKPIFQFESESDFVDQLLKLDAISRAMIFAKRTDKLSGNGKMFWIRCKNTHIDCKKILENIELSSSELV